jgi:hypothetical protein
VLLGTNRDSPSARYHLLAGQPKALREIAIEFYLQRLRQPKD